jgi:hypothetical protein
LTDGAWPPLRWLAGPGGWSPVSEFGPVLCAAISILLTRFASSCPSGLLAGPAPESIGRILETAIAGALPARANGTSTEGKPAQLSSTNACLPADRCLSALDLPCRRSRRRHQPSSTVGSAPYPSCSLTALSLLVTSRNDTSSAPPPTIHKSGQAHRLRSLVEGAESRRADPGFRMAMGRGVHESVRAADSARTPCGHFADTLGVALGVERPQDWPHPRTDDQEAKQLTPQTQPFATVARRLFPGPTGTTALSRTGQGHLDCGQKARKIPAGRYFSHLTRPAHPVPPPPPTVRRPPATRSKRSSAPTPNTRRGCGVGARRPPNSASKWGAAGANPSGCRMGVSDGFRMGSPASKSAALHREEQRLRADAGSPAVPQARESDSAAHHREECCFAWKAAVRREILRGRCRRRTSRLRGECRGPGTKAG